MNYYPRYPGDYAKKTGHLSLLEHGVLGKLMDAYYATATPLRVDLEALYRICSAMTAHERAAVDRVVAEFFPVAIDGLRRNARCDLEIAKASKKIDAARINGGRGGRPPKNLLGSLGETHEEPGGFSGGNPAETQRKPTGKALQNQSQSFSSSVSPRETDTGAKRTPERSEISVSPRARAAKGAARGTEIVSIGQILQQMRVADGVQ